MSRNLVLMDINFTYLLEGFLQKLISRRRAVCPRSATSPVCQEEPNGDL